MTSLTTQTDERYDKILLEIFDGQRPYALGPFDKTLKKVEGEMASYAKRVDAEHRFILSNYADRLNKLAREYLEPAGVSYSFQMIYGLWGTFLTLGITVDELREVLPVLRLLSADGLTIVKRPAENELSMKVWKMLPRHVTEDTEHAVQLSVSVSAKSCERVQVGTRTEPVYETRCNWGAEATKELHS